MNIESQNANTKQGLIFLIVFLLSVALYAVWEMYIREDVKEHGVYTKCYVRNILGYKGGARIDIEYAFNGKQYTSFINYSGEGIAEREQYFITLLPNNPDVITFENSLVPECLKNVSPPLDGWKQMPTCNNN